MEYQSLIIAEETTIAEQEREFLSLHREIMYCGNMAATYAVEMAKNLKTMRDGKLFRAAEFATFGDYVENAVGIKERQAYNYISILENLPEEFLQSNAKLGVTKLALLAPLSVAERTDIVENKDVENLTVKQLQAEIEARQKKIEQMQIEFEEEKQSLAQSATDAQVAAKNADAEIEKLKRETADIQKKLAAKQTELSKAQSDASLEQSKLKKQIEELKDTPAEVQTVENPTTAAALNASNEKAAALAVEVETLKKQLAVASDATVLRFKVKFEELQRIAGEMFSLLDAIEPDKATKCRAAMKSVVGGWKL